MLQSRNCSSKSLSQLRHTAIAIQPAQPSSHMTRLRLLRMALRLLLLVGGTEVAAGADTGAAGLDSWLQEAAAGPAAAPNKQLAQQAVEQVLKDTANLKTNAQTMQTLADSLRGTTNDAENQQVNCVSCV